MVPGVGNADGPAAGLVWRIAKAENTAAGCGDERVAKTSCAEDLDHAIDSIAFAHSAGIDLDAGTVEVHRSVPCVQFNVLISDDFECVVELVGRWNVMSSAEKSPGAHERTDGDIESAFAGAAVFEAIGEELK